MQAGTEVVDAKDGEGSATLSTAYAGAIFAENCLRGLAGESVEDYAYVDEKALGGGECVSPLLSPPPNPLPFLRCRHTCSRRSCLTGLTVSLACIDR